MIEENRIAKWDNLKFFLILCVVIGHTLHSFLDYSQLAKGLYLFIYSFHMPAFIFVAGLFSKHAIQEKRREVVVQYLVIYLVMKFLDALAAFLSGSSSSFHFLWESGPGWFALALAVYMIVGMYVRKFDSKYIMAAAIFIGCVAGLDTHFGDHFASMRICVFLPVFLAGYYIKPEALIYAKNKGIAVTRKIAALLIFAALLIISISKMDVLYPALKMFKGKYEYADMDMGIEGVVLRLLCYAFWAVMIYIVIAIVPKRNWIFTWFGKRTMAIFVWHNFFVSLVMTVLGGSAFLYGHLSHSYVFAGICVAIIIAALCAYLPEFRIKKVEKKS